MQLKNTAAYIPLPKAQLEVSRAPFPICGKDELIIQAHAVAVNPVDWKVQDNAGFGLTYPFILGEDVAGEVLEVGKHLEKKFKVGQRVIANALGFEYGATYGAFQIYPCVRGETVCRIPDDVNWDEAVVLPLSVSTAASGLYVDSTLGLKLPEVEERKRKGEGWVLLSGGSSSVGSSVIQLARASGYEVVCTASPANYGYCKELGASIVLDYHSPDIVEVLVRVLKGEKVVGAYDAISTEATLKICATVLGELGGGRVVSVGGSLDDTPKGVEVVRFQSSRIVNEQPEVAEKVWGEFLPKALKQGVFRTAPGPLVVGEGLEVVQKGLDRQKKGVSAKKVVVRL